MTGLELSELIKLELELCSSNEINKWHGLSKENVLKRLVNPELIKYIARDTMKEYWLVFNEDINDPAAGYQIVYDEENEIFGLALKSSAADKNVGLLVGLYGSFIETLENM